MKSNQELDALEHELKALRIEFEKYFSGANDLPPGELQSKLDRRIRELRTRVRSSVDRFRLSTLEAQNNSYSEMFNRRLRAMEEGRSERPRKAAASPARTDLRVGVVISGKVPEQAAAALYQGLYSSAGPKPIDPDKFRSYLERQTALISAKTGCSQVRFRLVNEEGKTKLKAKPVRG